MRVRYQNGRYPGELIQLCYVHFDLTGCEYPDGWYVTGLVVLSSFKGYEDEPVKDVPAMPVYRGGGAPLPSVPLLREEGQIEQMKPQPLKWYDKVILWFHNRF